ncbi:MAG: YebC/PmpR family DNA-binding transcriptional regulator [Candidatus Saccharimonadales bacterium]
MSGHSKWSTIKREKGLKDAKRGAIFTRLGNLIAIAARSGTDPMMNSTLYMAIEKAKQANMPAVNIQRAIDRVSDKNATVMEEATYESMGPGGIGIIIEAATDNKNRTFPEIKSIVSKAGGRIADAGSVAFQFTRKGVIRVSEIGEDALLQVLDAGAMDAVEEDGELVIYTDQKDLARVRKSIVESGLTVMGAELQFVPNMMIQINDVETAEKLIKLLDAIDDQDDVMNVYHNADITVDLPE